MPFKLVKGVCLSVACSPPTCCCSIVANHSCLEKGWGQSSCVGEEGVAWYSGEGVAEVQVYYCVVG
eukprot:12917763-Prorocentrum_lima.AAC.1